MKTTKQFPVASDTILIVDDSPDNLIVMKKVLEKVLLKVKVLTCQYPEKVQFLLQEIEVALVVLDVQMPGVDGLELCKRIKNEAATSLVSVILITSHDSDPKMKAKGLSLGAADFITRPMDNTEFCARVKVALRVYHAESSLRLIASHAEAEAMQLGHVLEESLNEIFIIDAGTLRFLNVNRGGRENLGYSIGELREMSVFDIKSEMKVEGFTELVRPLRDGGEKKIQFETIHRRKDGTNYPVEVNLQLMSGDQPVFVAISNDITERKAVEEKLRESESRYAQLAEQNRTVAWEVDANGIYTYCSHVVEKVLGYRPDEIVGQKHFYDMYPEEGRYAFKKMTLDAFSRKDVFHGLENQVETKDGRIMCMLTTGIPLLDEQGELLGYRGSDADITERKQAEQALKKSEEQFRLTLEAVTDSVFVDDIETGNILHVNQAACDLLGYSLAEFKQMNQVDVYPEAMRKEYRKIFLDRVAKEGAFPAQAGVAAVQHRDGTVIPVEINARRAEITGRKVAVGCFHDLRGRVELERQRNEVLTRIQYIADQVPGMIYQFLQRPDGSSCYPYTSEKIRDIYRVTPEQVRTDDSDVFAIIHPDDFSGVVASIQASAASLTVWQYEYRVRFDDGTVRWLYGQSVPQREEDGSTLWHGFITDITEHKQAEELLRESESRFRDLFENAPLGYQSLDENGDILELNETWCKLLGYTKDEVLGRNFGDFVRSDFKDKFVKNFPKFKRRGYIRGIEFKMIRKDGSEVIASFDGTIGHKPDGSFKQTHCVLRDVTDQKALEEQLHQAQKMESIGRLAGGVAHDFNNMLQVILGYTDMALNETEPETALYNDLIESRKAAKRAADLTRQLLAFARKQTMTPKVLDLNETVSGMLMMLRRLIGEDIGLIWQPTAAGTTVKMDPSQIDQILANLCVNARDAIAGVGKLKVETGTLTADANFCAMHTDLVPGEYVTLSVSDTGCGMDQEMSKHIFEPFYTSKGVGEGTGLGLATVYGIVKQNNGSINLTSVPGKGTTFRLCLPRYLGEAVQLPVSVSMKAPSRGNDTVLLVEDEPSTLTLGKKMLESLGYRVLMAGLPDEAIAMAEKHAGEIHLLLTDVVMPQMNGLDLATRLTLLHPEIKHMFMSGYTADIIAKQGLIEEGVHFLQKPFTIQSLAAKVQEVLKG